MPIPFAHPAAVLPLRRHCNRWFNFPALVIGSLVPDAGYLFSGQELSTSSHQLLGSIAFGFPLGVLMLALLYGFRSHVVEMLPAPQKKTFRPLCRRPIGPLWIAGISLLIGIWSHVLWDSFTHADGWMAEHFTVLQIPVLNFEGRTARVCHLLWYGSSFAGVGWLYWSFEKWKLGFAGIRDALFLSILIVPVSLIHHLIQGWLGIALTAGLCGLLIFWFTLFPLSRREKVVRRPG